MQRQANLARLLISWAIIWTVVGRVWAQPSYTIEPIDLTGTNYHYSFGGGSFQNSIAQQLNSAGQVTGYSNRYTSSGGALGQDAWDYSGTSTQQIGLTGTNYSYAASGGTYESSTPLGLNDSGQATGTSNRYSSTGGALGLDAWYYNGTSTQRIGLSGTNYSYAASGGTYQNGSPQALNSAGQIMGYSLRYNSSGGDLGEDVWVYNESSTQRIGLSGTTYSYAATGGTYQYGYAQLLNAAGDVAGISDRYTSGGVALGYDCWLYNGSSTQQIGLTGSNYGYTVSGGSYRINSPVVLNGAGQILGYSERYNSSGASLGADCWLYNGSSTQQIGLSGANYSYVATGGTYQYSDAVLLNANGKAAGLTARYSSSGGSLGQDSWIYNGSSTQQIGLTGASYSYAASGGTYQLSSPALLDSAGHVAGYSARYSSSGGSLGQDNWFYDGSSTRQIGLTGTNYSYAASGGSYETSSLVDMNDAGQVLGYSLRYNSGGSSLGRDGWFFDSATDTTSMLQFSVNSLTNQSNTLPEILTDTGVVLGTYELYSGSTDEGSHVFYWSPNSGFADLGSLVSGSLSAQGWQSLSAALGAEGSAADGSPLFIAGDGVLTNQTGGHTAFLMSHIVPEPGTLSLLLVGSSLLLRPRRKSSLSS